MPRTRPTIRLFIAIESTAHHSAVVPTRPPLTSSRHPSPRATLNLRPSSLVAHEQRRKEVAAENTGQARPHSDPLVPLSQRKLGEGPGEGVRRSRTTTFGTRPLLPQNRRMIRSHHPTIRHHPTTPQFSNFRHARLLRPPVPAPGTASYYHRYSILVPPLLAGEGDRG